MKSYVISIISTFSRLIMGAGVVILVARIVSFEDFSNYILGLTIGSLLALMVDSGIYNEILVSARKESLHRLVSRVIESTVVRVCMYICLILVVNFTLNLFFEIENIYILNLGLFSVIISSLVEVYFISLKSIGKLKKEAVLVGVQLVATLGIVSLSIFGEIAIYFGLLLPRAVLLIFLLNKNFSIICLQLKRAGLNIVSYTLNYYKRLSAFSIDSILTGLNNNLDTYFIMFLVGKDSLALYQSANKIYMACITLASAIATVIIPSASLMDTALLRLIKVIAPFSMFGCGLAVLYFMFSEWLSVILFDFDLKLDTYIFQLLSLLIFIRYLSASLGSGLMICGYQRVRAKINFFVNVISIFIGAFYITNIESAVMVVIFSQVLILIAYSLCCGKLVYEEYI